MTGPTDPTRDPTREQVLAASGALSSDIDHVRVAVFLGELGNGRWDLSESRRWREAMDVPGGPSSDFDGATA